MSIVEEIIKIRNIPHGSISFIKPLESVRKVFQSSAYIDFETLLQTNGWTVVSNKDDESFLIRKKDLYMWNENETIGIDGVLGETLYSEDEEDEEY